MKILVVLSAVVMISSGACADPVRSGTKSWEVFRDDKHGRSGKKDLNTGLIWYPALEGEYQFQEFGSEPLGWKNVFPAKAACEDVGLRLPTKEEFERAEKHGLRSQFSDFSGHWFWTSSFDDRNHAVSFSGDWGTTDYDDRSYRGSVRCVR